MSITHSPTACGLLIHSPKYATSFKSTCSMITYQILGDVDIPCEAVDTTGILFMKLRDILTYWN